MIGPDSPLPKQLRPEQPDTELIEAVAKRVVGMGMATPAVFFLESTRPLSYVGSQVLVFLEPFVKSFLNLASYDRFVALMEDRKNIEILMDRIERLDDEAREAEAARKSAENEARRRAEAERRRLGIQPPGFWARWLGRKGGAGRGPLGR